MPRKWLVVSICVVLLAGCRVVGPVYTAPPVIAPPNFKESAPPAYSGALPGAWEPAKPQDSALKGKWWEIFNEPELNALEDELNINNQNIAQYFQNFMAARAQVREARAGLFPTAAVAPAYSRTQTGGKTGPAIPGASNTSSSYSLPFDVSWEPDLWGRVQNSIRQSQYAAQVSAADLENERLTEQADLAVYYFELRGQDALQDLYDRTVKAYQQSLELTRVLVDTGIDSPEATAQAEVTLENAQAAGIGIAENRAIYEHAIATLTGKPASSFSMPVKLLATPVPAIPVGVPSQLLQRRPDIAAAERTMAEANALIGVETAAFYPTVSLSLSGGLSSSLISKLFSVPALFWSLGASASQTVFDAGLRKNTIAQYTANYNADVAAYKQTILTAFQQVEDYIAALRVLSQEIQKQDEAIASARRYVDIAMARYQTGLDPYLNVITAQTTLLSDEQSAVTLRVSEITAAVQLVQALGGGWDQAQIPPPQQISSDGAAKQVAAVP
jgi:NodT family efflux transporter outer membrane factor (OMF) lipoprotein